LLQTSCAAATKPKVSIHVLGQVGEGDFFWELNGRRQFPKVAEDVDVQLQKYKAAVEDINRKTGSNMDPNADPNDMMQVRLL
jgi:hypothetical protein